MKTRGWKSGAEGLDSTTFPVVEIISFFSGYDKCVSKFETKKRAVRKTCALARRYSVPKDGYLNSIFRCPDRVKATTIFRGLSQRGQM